MKRLSSRSSSLVLVVAASVNCGGRSSLYDSPFAPNSGGTSPEGGAGGGPIATGGSPPIAPSSNGGASFFAGGAASLGGSPPSAGGAQASAGGASPAVGGSMAGVGGAMATEGSFYFLGNTWPAAEQTEFASRLYTFSQYVPGEAPWHFYEFPGDITLYFTNPPPEDSFDFLMGVSTWSEGERQFIWTHNTQTNNLVGHGVWGRSPFGNVESLVDASVRLDESMLVVLIWNALANQSEIWTMVDQAALAEDQPIDRSKEELGKLVYESPNVRLKFHGVTGDARALFSTDKDLLFLSELGALSLVESIYDELLRVQLSAFAPGVLVVGSIGGVQRIQVYDEEWLGGSVEGAIDPESVTWASSTSVLYDTSAGVYQWNAYGRNEPARVADAFDTYKPRGASVLGDFGTAMRAQSEDAWQVAFINGDSVQFCGPSPHPIRGLQLYEHNGRAGVLFDEFDPDDKHHIGRIYFCSPGSSPIDLLSEHEIYGRLLASSID